MSNRRPKRNQIIPEQVDGDQSTRRSSFNGRVTVSETAKTSSENRTGRTPWWYRLFGRPLRKDRSPSRTVTKRSSRQQRVTSSDGPTTTTCWGLFNCCRRGSRVTPLSGEETQKKVPQKRHRSPAKNRSRTQRPDSFVEVTPVVEFLGFSEDEKESEKEDQKAAAPVSSRPVSPVLNKDPIVKVLCQRPAKQDTSSKRTNESNEHCGDAAHVVNPHSLGGQQVCLYGFPNPAQICYVNSSFQSLLTLTEFITDVSCQEEVWSLSPQAELMSRFTNIVRCRGSPDSRRKLQALMMFKKVVSVQAPEFTDPFQKDAHEFITTILDQMRSFAPRLQEVAAFAGKSYSCPVKRNLLFKMQNIRTCKSCGTGSVREEEFTNLSLDLVPGASVQQMLHNYQTETQLEYYCMCGGHTSCHRSTFLTLPRVLVLHLKRFSFTQSLQMVKLHDPVDLYRELMVTSSSQVDGWYSLVSVISHLGSGGRKGHYISDGLHPDKELDAPGDPWLHYNDAHVTETTGAAVCERRRGTAYILFYQRRM